MMDIEQITKGFYKEHLTKLLEGRDIGNLTINSAKSEVIETVQLMLEDQDPIYIKDIAREFNGIFRWTPSYYDAHITKILKETSDETGIKIISLGAAIENFYKIPIFEVRRDDRNAKKRLKVSRLAYKSQSKLDAYIESHTKLDTIAMLI